MLHELAQRIFPQQEGLASYSTPVSAPDDASLVQQGLHPLLGADLSKFPTPPFLHLDKNTSSGGKFWGATATPQGLTLTWGRSGTVGQRVSVDAAQCANRDPVQELLNRTLKKLREGYALDRNSTFIPKENA